MATCLFCASCLPRAVRNQHRAIHKNAAGGTSPRLFGGQTQHFTNLKHPLVTSFLYVLQNLCAAQTALVIKYPKQIVREEKIQLTTCNKIYSITDTIQFLHAFPRHTPSIPPWQKIISLSVWISCKELLDKTAKLQSNLTFDLPVAKMTPPRKRA